jgi:hypothetical protein
MSSKTLSSFSQDEASAALKRGPFKLQWQAWTILPTHLTDD